MNDVAAASSSHTSGVSTCFEAAPSPSLWVTMAPTTAGACQNFCWDLLRQLAAVHRSIAENRVGWLVDGEVREVHYLVLQSAHPRHFSLGGDLDYFRTCIQTRDYGALREYAMFCTDLIHAWSTRFDRTLTSIALIQGRALGGGFEAALAADYLVAEEHSELGFPEILFGLFPCTGGMSLLARRIGVHRAERMMSNARLYTARELLDLGVVDEVCPRGTGAAAVREFIKGHACRRRARLALQRGRKRLTALDYMELRTVVDEWVEIAMALDEGALRIMDMLVRMQRADAAVAAGARP